ncbi:MULTISPECIES: hypothetical protein [Nocardia]|uniref:hypothetical protein n=1 Tax=Nocardia TaxID=1817 RepID=UPI002454AFCA|nr:MULTISPECIES: hypothetical protein [Nocardia]
MTPEFTADERALLRRVPQWVGHCIANPAGGIQAIRDSHGAGAGGGFHYQFTKSAVIGQWYEWTPVAWATEDDIRPTGTPIEFRAGVLLRDARVSYARLQQWCQSQPAGVRAQALVWWRTYPENTRNLGALVQLTLQQLAEPEPATELTLFDLKEHTHA